MPDVVVWRQPGGASICEIPPPARRREIATHMLTADLGDTSLASYRPDIAGELDSVGDRLREALAPFISPDLQRRAFAAMDDVVERGACSSGLTPEQIATETLRAIYRDTTHEKSVRIIAAAALKRLGKDGRSYQAIGDEFAVTRACIHEHSRRIERNTGLRCRSDKGERARQISKDRATGRRRAGKVPTGGVTRSSKSLGGLFSFFRLRGV